jgi:hypothetical protein
VTSPLLTQEGCQPIFSGRVRRVFLFKAVPKPRLDSEKDLEKIEDYPRRPFLRCRKKSAKKNYRPGATALGGWKLVLSKTTLYSSLS